MKKQKESLHSTLEENQQALQKENIGNGAVDNEQEDSVIEKPSTGGSAELHNRRRTALLKLTFTAILAVLVVGVAVVQNSEMPWNVEQQLAQLNQGDSVTRAKEQAAAVAKDVTAEIPKEANTANQSTETQNAETKSKDTQTNSEQRQKTATAAADSFSWQLPAYGEIIKGYGYSYDETWHDYRFHSGVDIALEKGEEVYAVRGGTVTEVGKTKALGEYIRVDYGNSLVGYYFGIDVKDGLQTGSSISQNQVLGVVCDPPLQESDLPPHYHFALLQNGRTVDPAKLMQ